MESTHSNRQIVISSVYDDSDSDSDIDLIPPTVSMSGLILKFLLAYAVTHTLLLTINTYRSSRERATFQEKISPSIKEVQSTSRICFDKNNLIFVKLYI